MKRPEIFHMMNREEGGEKSKAKAKASEEQKEGGE